MAMIDEKVVLDGFLPILRSKLTLICFVKHYISYSRMALGN